MVDGVGGLVFFDVGDGVGAFEGGGRLGNCGVVIEAAECLYATSVGDANVDALFTASYFSWPAPSSVPSSILLRHCVDSQNRLARLLEM